ncbi:hypothetical protein, partial [Acidithiobacillus thiooxidans]|uniref:hypothetical protein n=1 Tax=Acidithiobacillus thiooxidans TaxID=930 RepID=UPI001C06BBE8
MGWLHHERAANAGVSTPSVVFSSGFCPADGIGPAGIAPAACGIGVCCTESLRIPSMSAATC